MACLRLLLEKVSVVFVWTSDSFVLGVCLVSNSYCNAFVCSHLLLFDLNCVISGITCLYDNSNTSDYHSISV